VTRIVRNNPRLGRTQYILPHETRDRLTRVNECTRCGTTAPVHPDCSGVVVAHVTAGMPCTDRLASSVHARGGALVADWEERLDLGDLPKSVPR